MFKSSQILKEEEKFLKMNAEIDMKTQDLLREVEQIKESNSNIEELCTKSEEKMSSCLVEDVTVNSPVLSTEKSFDLNDYLLKLKNENSLSLPMFDSIKSDPCKTSNTEDFKSKRKLSQSAKATSYTLSTTNLGDQAKLPLGITRHKSELKLKQTKFDNEFIPESVKGMGHEGTIRFLSAKVKVLGEQLQTMQKEEKRYQDSVKELQAQKERITEEKEKLAQQVNAAKNVIVKCEQQSQTLITQLQTTQAENGHLRRELETLRKELRQNKQTYNANELRLNRTLEEVDKLKSAIQQMKQAEKESKESNRKKIDGLTNAIKLAEKQRVELLNGFKKQLIIINNLRKQNGLIEVAKLLKTAEDDFVNFLDCNPPTR